MTDKLTGMNTKSLKTLALLAVLSIGLHAALGCGRAVVRQENPRTIDAARYDAVFDATVETLRDMNFIVDRQDRRFGVVTTLPRMASTAAVPWASDNSTAEQFAYTTLNHQRRVVRVQISPATQPGPAMPYELGVAVTVEQRQLPVQQLHTARVRSLEFQGRTGGVALGTTERGEEVSYWHPIARDQYLESRLIQKILSRAAAPHTQPQPAAAADPADPPTDAARG